MIDRITTALSRRNLLMGLAASAAAASVADAATAPQENPDLLALADELPTITREYAEARAEVARIVKEWSPQWPVPSEAMFAHAPGCKDYRSIDGHGIEMPWGVRGITKMPQLGTPEYYQAQTAYYEGRAAHCASTKSQRGLKFHRIWADRNRAQIEPSRAFWTEVDRITKASGIQSAIEKESAAREALRAQVDKIMKADECTIAGSLIKAQALQAWAGVERAFVVLNPDGARWADALGKSILRHAQPT